jgi:hypothetical protein
MKTYKVTFDLILEDDSSHPRKWLAEAVYDSLRSDNGEDIDNMTFEETGVIPNKVD